MYNNDFLMHNETAKTLYKSVKNLPIIDYHNHLEPKEIYENLPFKNISKVWLENDHYKWRLIRFAGVKFEKDDSDLNKFKAYASALETAYLNPLFDWSHMELKTFFGIDKNITKENAEDIYNEANKFLEKSLITPVKMLEDLKVEILCTTNDINDDLKYHKLIEQKKDINIKILPTFRPDNLFSFDENTFKETIDKLQMNTNNNITDIKSLKKSILMRLDFFSDNFCKLADHGITDFKYFEVDVKEANDILIKRLNNSNITLLEIGKLNVFLLRYFLKEYFLRNWTVQYHLGALRNRNEKGYIKMGKDSGYDSISSHSYVNDFNLFLNEVNLEIGLPRIIIYPLQSYLYEAVATMCSNFSENEIGKVQLGAAWWFNDHVSGIEKQLSVFAEYLHINYFLGMLTDSRSFLSFVRHDYFRRVLVNFIGEKVEKGLIPKDMNKLIKLVQDISYNNSRNLLKL